MNIQYAISNDRVYVLKQSACFRTVPLVSKVCNILMAQIATKIIMSAQDKDKSIISKPIAGNIPHFGVKEACFRLI